LYTTLIYTRKPVSERGY